MIQETLVALDRPDSRAAKDLQDQQDSLVHLEQLDLLVCPVLKVKEALVQLVVQEELVTKDLSVPQVAKVLQASLDRTEIQERLALLDRLDQRDHLVYKDLKDPREY